MNNQNYAVAAGGGRPSAAMVIVENDREIKFDEEGHIMPYTSESIDPALTYLNVNLAPKHGSLTGRGYLDNLIESAVANGARLRDDTKVLCSVVLTCPETITDRDRQIEFFKSSYKWFVENYCQGNEALVVSSAIHFDEPGARPHMHFDACPLVRVPKMENDKTKPLMTVDKETGEKVQARNNKGVLRWKQKPKLDAAGKPVYRYSIGSSKMATLQLLQRQHNDLETYLQNDLRDPSIRITLDDEDPRKTLSKLSKPAYSAAMKGLQALESDKEVLQSAVSELQEQAQKETDRLEYLRRDCTETEEQIRSYEAGISDLEPALQQARSREQKLIGATGFLRERISDLKRLTQRARAGIQTLKDGILRLNEGIGTLGRPRLQYADIEPEAAKKPSWEERASKISEQVASARAESRQAERPNLERGYRPPER